MRPFLGMTGAAVLLLAAAPAVAHDRDGRPDEPPPAGPGYPGESRGRFDPAARDAWLADCRERISPRDAGPGPGECEAYLDRYYAAFNRGGYAAVQSIGVPGQSYAYAAPGYSQPAGGYGAPMMMVPVTMVPQPQPHCVETVEYVTEYVPAPRRRTIPPRARKIVRDKRVKLQSVK